MIRYAPRRDAALPGDLRVVRVDLDLDAPLSDPLFDVLSDDERAAAARFLRHADAVRSAATRAVLRRELGAALGMAAGVAPLPAVGPRAPTARRGGRAAARLQRGAWRRPRPRGLVPAAAGRGRRRAAADGVGLAAPCRASCWAGRMPGASPPRAKPRPCSSTCGPPRRPCSRRRGAASRAASTASRCCRRTATAPQWAAARPWPGTCGASRPSGSGASRATPPAWPGRPTRWRGG